MNEGSIMKEARRKLRLSVREMADHVFTVWGYGKGPANPRTIRRWEDGAQDVPAPVLEAARAVINADGKMD